MSGPENYPGKIELNGSFAYLMDADKQFRDKNLDYTYVVSVPKSPDQTVRALHQADIARYRFEVVAPDFLALEGQPMNVHEVAVNPETSQAVMYTAERLVEASLSPELREAYADMQKAISGFGAFEPSTPKQVKDFEPIFQGFLDHLISKQ